MTRKGKSIFLGTETESEICEKAMALEFVSQCKTLPVSIYTTCDGSSIGVVFSSVAVATECEKFIKSNT